MGYSPINIPQLQHSNVALPVLPEARHNLQISLSNAIYLVPTRG